MNLLLISAHYPPIKCGMADYAERLCRYYKNITGFNTSVITVKTAGKPEFETIDEGVRIFRIIDDWDNAELDAILDLIKKESPDIVHLQYHENDFPKLEMICSSLHEIKKCFPGIKTVNSLAAFDLLTSEGKKRVEKLISGSDFITVTTDYDYDIITDNFKDNTDRVFKVYDRPNIIFDKNLSVDKFKIRQKNNVSKNDFLLFNFGFINPNKGIENIFHALKVISDKGLPIKLLMIGELHHGDDSESGNYFNSLRNLAYELKIEENIIWTGHLSDIDTSKTFLSADAAIMPFRDGLSGKRSSFWSVLDHGVPAITTVSTDNPLPEGIVDEENVLLVPGDDVNKLTEAICRLVNDPDLCKKIGANAKRLIDNRYSWEHIVEELLAIYRIEL